MTLEQLVTWSIGSLAVRKIVKYMGDSPADQGGQALRIITRPATEKERRLAAEWREMAQAVIATIDTNAGIKPHPHLVDDSGAARTP